MRKIKKEILIDNICYIFNNRHKTATIVNADHCCKSTEINIPEKVTRLEKFALKWIRNFSLRRLIAIIITFSCVIFIIIFAIYRILWIDVRI